MGFVLLGPAFEIPDELKPLTYVVTSLFPDEGEVQATVAAVLQQAQRSADAEAQSLLVNSLRGWRRGIITEDP